MCVTATEIKIVAILHRSAGNEYVGDMWRETKIFDPQTPVIELVRWAHSDATLHKDRLWEFNRHLEITVAK